jgi:hypothetical protein
LNIKPLCARRESAPYMVYRRWRVVSIRMRALYPARNATATCRRLEPRRAGK